MFFIVRPYGVSGMKNKKIEVSHERGGVYMDNHQIIEEALALKPQERYKVVESLLESLLESLDIPNPTIDTLWADEAEKRLENYRKNKIKTISFEEVFHS